VIVSDDATAVKGILLLSLIGLVVLCEQRGSAQPSDPLASLLEQFRGVQSWSASFVEEKEIALLSEPLINFGRIEYSRPRRLERRTIRPFESLWRLEGHLVTIDEAGENTTIDLREYPDASLLATAFVDVLDGDLHRLRKSFDVSFVAQRGDRYWNLELRPLQDGSRALFRRIELRGLGGLVHRLIIIGSAGDKSTTNFTTVRLQPNADGNRPKETKGVQ
jgi:hypothetical protein